VAAVSRGRCRHCHQSLPLVLSGRALKAHPYAEDDRCPGSGLAPSENGPDPADWRGRALLAEEALRLIQELPVGPGGVDPAELGRALDIAS
jgi:hypothetical protein